MKKINGKQMMVLAAALFTLNMNASAFAAEIGAQQAKDIAVKVVPASASYIVTENDIEDKNYDVKFYDSAKAIEYEVEVSRLSGKITEWKMDMEREVGSNNVALSEADAKAIVQKEVPDAKIKSVRLELDNGLKEYEVKFENKELRGEMHINPETGKVIEKDFWYKVK